MLHDVSPEKRTENALREAEQRSRALVENLPAVVYQVAPDDDRRTLYASSQVERALGYSREEWLDQPDIWVELLHPDDREPTLAAHDEHNLTGEPWSREYRLIASDGRAALGRRWVTIPAGTWHQVVVRGGHWVVLSFHTALAEDLIEERPRRDGPTGERRHYLGESAR